MYMQKIPSQLKHYQATLILSIFLEVIISAITLDSHEEITDHINTSCLCFLQKRQVKRREAVKIETVVTSQLYHKLQQCFDDKCKPKRSFIYFNWWFQSCYNSSGKLHANEHLLEQPVTRCHYRLENENPVINSEICYSPEVQTLQSAARLIYVTRRVR